MTHIRFWSVYCPIMAAAFEPVLLRVDGGEVFQSNMEQGDTVEIDVRLPIVTMNVELGTSDLDGQGNPTGPFHPFLYEKFVDTHHIEYHDSLKLVILHDESTVPQTAVFRGRIAGHEGKYELSFSLPG
ncbi:hypothetical protein [Streptomyces sp. NPDC093225]|uniref:hypothetical protein n=1 Tax=Streptomyces sp. NPDC093225 TaxID=3366034 RepID=UPI00382C8102